MNDFQPLEIVHVDLAEGLSKLLELGHVDGGDVYAVLWRAGIPLGHLELSRAQMKNRATLADLIARQIAPAVGDSLFAFGFEGRPRGRVQEATRNVPPLQALVELDRPLDQLANKPAMKGSSYPPISVIVCTRNHPQQLARCLSSLLDLRIPADEIIVVDNDPSAPGTLNVVQALSRITYVGEPELGLSRARNAGLRHASNDIVAFTDDDTVVHPDWVQRLCEGFEEPDIMSVTGLVLPAELSTPAQVLFEKAMGGFSQGYQRINFDRSFVELNKDIGPPVWRIGAGANMAIRRRAFELVGTFDERLGAGAAGCSEDSEFWYRLLAEGWRCRYQPTAVVFHFHRSDLPGLVRQAHAYLRGHVAALFVQYSRHGHRGNLRRALLALPVYLIQRTALAYLSRGLQRRIFAAYISGYLRGLAYLPEIRRDHTIAASVGRDRPEAVRWGDHDKLPLRQFLRSNPYPHPLSEGFFYREKMRAIHTVAPDRPFERILEIGGGRSGLTAMLYPYAEVITLDLEIDFAASPLNQRVGTRFLCADATLLPFPDAVFDAVCMFDVLEHILRDDLAASEARRVLRPGGYLLITSPNEHWRFPYYRALRPLCPTDRHMMEEWGHVRRGYTLSDLQRLLHQAPAATASFITPITVIGHDVAFSLLRARPRRLALATLSPLTWLGYWFHRPAGRGTETASSWIRADKR